MPSVLPTLLDELLAALPSFQKPRDGLQKYLRLDLPNEVKQAVEKAVERYSRRVISIRRAIEVMEALVQDGYPTIIQTEITAHVFASLKDDSDDILAALAQFTSSPEAVSGTLTLSDV